MFLAYFDESGDEGYPKYSSELFVLASVYMHSTCWKENYEILRAFRKFLKESYGLPIKQEFHTKEFITGKFPYGGIYNFQQRKEIVTHFCKMAATLKVRCIVVAIDKLKINRANYDVLENALTYNVQRIENDLNKALTVDNFIMITDEGRVNKMKNVTRAMQKINYIPSLYNPHAYRKEIKRLIEDPLPKKSHESYFIQLADLITYISTLYVKQNLCKPKLEWSRRVKTVFNYGEEILLMDALKNAFNTKASRSNPYGLVYYPK